MRAGAVIQQHYPYFCRFQRPFCCKTRLGGHFKGGVIPFSFFKINVTGNIYKPERQVWPVKILFEKFNTRLFQLGSWTSWCFISYYWRRYLVDVRSPTPIMAHLHSLFHLGVHCGAVSGERVKLSPLIFFFVNLSAALYYLNAWKKQAIWLFLFICLTPLTAFYEYSWNARRVLWKLARETHTPEDWVPRETNMAANQTVQHVCS